MTINERFRAWQKANTKQAESDMEHMVAYQRLIVEQAFMAGYRVGHVDGGVAATRRETPNDSGLGELVLQEMKPEDFDPPDAPKA